MLNEKPPIISEKMHDLMHALVMVEKYHDEEQRWLEIVNKLVNEMVLDGNSVDSNNTRSNNLDNVGSKSAGI